MADTATPRYITKRRVQVVFQTLSAVDLYVLRQVYQHPFLTAAHLAVLLASNLDGGPAYPSCSRTAINRRLARLRQAELVVGYRPPALRGTAPCYYFLDELGAHVVAQQAGLTRAELGWSVDQVRGRLPAWQHQAEVNTFFIALLQYGRAAGVAGLRAWHSEAVCQAEFTWRGRSAQIAPDGLAVYVPDTSPYYFFLEWDRGLGPLTSVRAKVERYLWYRQSQAYQERYPVCPGLWLVTTTDGRQRQIVRLLREQMERVGRHLCLVTQWTRLARDLGGAVWIDPQREGLVTFLGQPDGASGS